MKIVFMGTPQAAIASLERILRDGHEVAAVYTQPDKPAGRGNRLAASPVKEFALQNNLPIYQPSKIKTPEASETFKSHQADVAVVVAYGRILPETFLQAFPKGAINVHFSLLPKYRGAAPVNWAIVNGEKTTGVTTMQMDAGLDTGAILLQRQTDIGETETAVELMARLDATGADLLSETLAMYDELTPQPQTEAQATFAPIMKKEDGLIDWRLNAEAIFNRVRGFQPFPRSYTFYEGKRIVFWQTEVLKDSLGSSNAGEILEAKGANLIIGCGDNTALKIIEAQAEGKKRMPARDFLNGVKLEAGKILER